MSSQPGTIFGREPAMDLALVQALIALVVAFGLNLAPDQGGAVVREGSRPGAAHGDGKVVGGRAIPLVVLGLITRSRVSPAS